MAFDLEIGALQLLPAQEDALLREADMVDCGWSCTGSTCNVTCLFSCFVTNN